MPTYTTFTALPAATLPLVGTEIMGGDQGPDTVRFTAQDVADLAVDVFNWNSQSGAYTLLIGDANNGILHPAADTTARIWTIPANSSVAFPIGTAITFCAQNASGVITISITTDTMRLAGTGSTGSRTLAANGVATALKLTSTEWLISGTGLT